MAVADPRDAVIRRQIQSVQFGFYTDSDVRSRSVLEVTSPQAFDAMGTPLPRGLYDPAMGPHDKFGPPCITCGCLYQSCPGHSGHVELCIPAYHPILFPIVVKLLRCKCLNCHRFRIDKLPINILLTKFHLIRRGKLQEALELDTELAQTSTLKTGNKNQANVQGMEQVLLRKRRQYNNDNDHQQVLETSYDRELKRLLTKSFIAACNSAKKCPHCGAFSPKIRQDSHNKIFQTALSQSAARMNTADGIQIKSALSDSHNGDDDDDAGGYESDDSVIHSNNNNLSALDKSGDDAPSGDKFMHALEVEAQVRRTWIKHPELCSCVFGGSPDADGYKVFFMRAVPVPPSRFRPPMVLGAMTVENAQNAHLSKTLQLNDRIRTLLAEPTETAQAQALTLWISLQTTINVYMDSSKDPSAAGAAQNNQNGIRQILEKKEGIFRKHMMGKRVDYCCRSVISPDPYVGTNEIGIPRHFAQTLTYPTPVSDLNVEEMRKLVVRGPKLYPGAGWVQFPDGRRVDLSKMHKTKREGIAARLLAILKRGGRPAIVGRQLRNGDMMLVNRQPTLHKPGIMAHYVRVLHSPTQKTIRMHYANCNTYNADFDGDEMNCHFPQNDIASAESKYICATDLQYIVPTDGSPLRGLIQDHVDSGVKMTCKDTFFEKWEYQQLLFAALASLPGLEVIRMDADIEMMPPAIMKPKQLWTGKQVISTLLRHVSRGNDRDDDDTRENGLPNISVERKAKTSVVMFGEEQMEHKTLIRDGELLRGVLDKASFGHSDFSMVHAVYEAQGPAKAGLLLNALGRLFTAHLQYYSGHSCRMEDLILTKETNARRRELIQRAYNIGARSAKAWADAEGGKVAIESVADKPGAERPLKPVESAAAAAKIGQLLSGREGKANFAALDGYCMSQLNPLASEIIKACLPNGLEVPFPTNTFSLMVNTGAKGSTVNQSQVSCALGQQALEGRRVPRLASGRTLPSFAPYDPSPRADGFILDRFLTGIRPQEYYFHCMAGREGLVDTAVKTSRSGYLQRCLVKHLEELKVCYDSTVRNGEGGVVQFLYGEDGLDPTKAAFLDCEPRTFEYLARNYEAMSRRYTPLPNASIELAATDADRHASAKDDQATLLKVGGFVRARRLRVGSRWVRGTLCAGWFDAVITKVNSDGTYDIKYLSDNRTFPNVPLEARLGRCGGVTQPAESSTCKLIMPTVPDPVLSGARRSENGRVLRVGSSGVCVAERVAAGTIDAVENNLAVKTAIKAKGITPEDFGNLVAAKYGSALCAPGEAVGSIAAQSVGEPSTQMTLNTFHLAGSGANVTLGIPRLREIIMTASRELKTPTMSIPLHESVTDKDAVKLTRFFSKLTLNELIANHKGITVTETLLQGDGGDWRRAYHVSLKFHPAERINEAFGLGLEDVAAAITRTFKAKLTELMKRELRRSSAEGDVASIEVSGGGSSTFVPAERKSSKNDRDDLEDEEEDDDNEDVVGEEDGVMGARFGHKREMESYGDMDDDDRQAANESGPQSMHDEEASEGSDDEEDDTGGDTRQDKTPDRRFKAFTNMSEEPKLDYETNAIHMPPLRVDPAARPLLMVGLVERAASATLVRARRGISEAYINDEDGRGRCLQTAGVNFTEFWKLERVDHSRLASNDIWAMRCAYGVEAARNNIVEQIRSVFGAYGISVDPRHLSLIADYMTFDGGFKPMNRIGMNDISSPFLQMSFETTANFMTDAAMHGRKEPLMSPSANIVIGRPVRHGTGAFDVLSKA